MAAARLLSCAPVITVLFVCAACASPRTAIANLGELYADRSGEQAKYAKEVTDRGFFARSGQAARDLYSTPPPLSDPEPLDDPVEFAIENLAELALAEPDDLDLLERTRAIAIVAEIGRIDPSRIVRARAYFAAVELAKALPASDWRFEIRPVDETATNAALDPLIHLASAPAEKLETLEADVNAQAGALLTSAQALLALRPENFALAQKLLLLATKCGRLAQVANGRAELVSTLETASQRLACQTAFLAARADLAEARGVADLATDVRIAAGLLLVTLDAIAATEELSAIYALTPETITRVAWLKELASAKARAANVHPKLRAPLAQELDSEDAAVAYWAKRAVAHLLALDPDQTTIAELRGRWLALGEWERS